MPAINHPPPDKIWQWFAPRDKSWLIHSFSRHRHDNAMAGACAAFHLQIMNIQTHTHKAARPLKFDYNPHEHCRSVCSCSRDWLLTVISSPWSPGLDQFNFVNSSLTRAASSKYKHRWAGLRHAKTCLTTVRKKKKVKKKIFPVEVGIFFFSLHCWTLLSKIYNGPKFSDFQT